MTGGRDAQLPVRASLRQLVARACEITGARFGVLAVLSSESAAFDLIAVGLTAEELERAARIPADLGLLGAVVRGGDLVRVAELAADSRFSGLAIEPPIKSFVGVPLESGSRVLGALYLADKDGGAPFGEADAQLVEILGVGAALALGCAAEAERAELDRQRLKTVFDAAPVTITFFGPPDGHLVLANPAAERLFERKLAAVPFAERPLAWGVYHPDGHLFAPAELPSYRSFHGETVVNQEAMLVLPTGRRVPVLVDAAQVRSETGAVLGSVDIIRDDSAAKELERLREEFAQVVAHDLRNPLQTILMQTEIVRERAVDGVASVPVDVLDRIEKSCLRLSVMSFDLLDAARIDLGRVDVELQPLRLDEAATAARHKLGALFETHPVEQTSVEALVMADPRRVEQILVNLLENAAKYSAPTAPIAIRITRDDKGATCSIEDHGTGIAPGEQALLFDRFHQAKRARLHKTGLGLGLYITRGLVEAQGGRLWFGTEVGRGSTFHVWLPLAT